MRFVTRILLPKMPVEVPENGLSIGQVAKATHVGIEALRYYERENLMLSATPRDGGGRRRYREADVAWIMGLVMLRETGMTIADLRAMAEINRHVGTEMKRLEFLRQHRTRVIDEMERTKRHLAAIEHKINAYQEMTSPGEIYEEQ